MFCIIIRKLPYVYAKTSAFHVSIFRVKSLHFNNWWLGVLGRLGGLGVLGELGILGVLGALGVLGVLGILGELGNFA